MPSAYYATVEQVKTEVTTSSVSATLTANLYTYIEQASNIIDRMNRWLWYEPRIETRYYDASGRDIDAYTNRLSIRYPLLSLTSVKLGDTSQTELTSAGYRLSPRGRAPYDSIINTSNTLSWFSWDDTPLDAIEIVGVWGYHSDYANAWKQVTTLSGNIASATATSATVTSASDIGTGNLLLINSEYIRVTAISGTTLTIERGVNGSTATTHTSADTVSVWQVEPSINRACIRLASFFNARKGAFQRYVFSPDGGLVEFPSGHPLEVNLAVSAIDWANYYMV